MHDLCNIRLYLCHFFSSCNRTQHMKSLSISISNSIQRPNIFHENRTPDSMSSFHPLAALFVEHLADLDQSPFPLREQPLRSPYRYGVPPALSGRFGSQPAFGKTRILNFERSLSTWIEIRPGRVTIWTFVQIVHILWASGIRT